MVENVQTGGLKSFQYSENEGELDPERKESLRVGYAEAEERKKREKRNKIIFWLIIVLIVLGIMSYFLLNFFV